MFSFSLANFEYNCRTSRICLIIKANGFLVESLIIFFYLDPDDGVEDHFVEYPEFRLLMVMLRRYIELYCAFDHIDSGDDNRIDLQVNTLIFVIFLI